MTPLLTRSKAAPPRKRGDLTLLVVVAGVGVALLLLVMPALRLPASVDAVSIANPHPWHVSVEVGRPDGSGWIGLGQVVRDKTHTFHRVIDPGDQWMFRFAYGGIHRGEIVVSRADLKQAGWKVTIPDEFAERMRGAGEAPSLGE